MPPPSLDQTITISAPAMRRPQERPQKSGTPVRLVVLPGGRRLAYTEYGSGTGFPVFYFHSQGSSRLEAALIHDAARRSNLRLVAIDRPGMGYSDHCPGMKHSDFARDALFLADILELPTLALLAWSGGAPFAFAMAATFPDRIRLVISLASLPAQQHLPPAVTLRAGLNQLGQAAMRGFIGLRQLWSTRDAQRYLDNLQSSVCLADRKILQDPRVSKTYFAGLIEGRRQGSSAIIRDTGRCFDSWNFALGKITAPVHLWHGSADSLVPMHYSASLAGYLPQATLRIARNRGHLFFMQHAEEILRQAAAVVQEKDQTLETWRSRVTHIEISRHSGDPETEFVAGGSLTSGRL